MWEDVDVIHTFYAFYFDKVAESTSHSNSNNSKFGRNQVVAVVFTISGVFLIIISFTVYWKRKTASTHLGATLVESNLNTKTNNEANHNQEDTYAEAQEGIYDKSGDSRHKKVENSEHFDTTKNLKTASTHLGATLGESSHNTKTNNEANHNQEDTYAEAQEGIYDKSGDSRHKKVENSEHFDTTKNLNKENSNAENKSSDKGHHIVCNINPTFESDSISSGEEQNKVAMVSSTSRSFDSTEEHKQKETTKAETKDWINLSHKEDDYEYSNTSRSLKEQHTNGNPESSIRNDQTNSYTNQTFEREENQEVDGERNKKKNDKQFKNGDANEGSTDQAETSKGDTIH
ncbi:GATA zinc finger domain-containing protein 14-like [Mytilus californianus]|uniref:GATA zinc finger domain-containing protein 14-like n=1 Tax=Mytilus californianus TaxID=6549 RepID=UPI002246D60F|nr:GATA zinc finger domain-containing protein 14-like [Mytilus californianus]